MSTVLDGWGEFPKIGLVVNGEEKFYSLAEAIPLWSSDWEEVEDTGTVLE